MPFFLISPLGRSIAPLKRWFISMVTFTTVVFVLWHSALPFCHHFYDFILSTTKKKVEEKNNIPKGSWNGTHKILWHIECGFGWLAPIFHKTYIYIFVWVCAHFLGAKSQGITVIAKFKSNCKFITVFGVYQDFQQQLTIIVVNSWHRTPFQFKFWFDANA